MEIDPVIACGIVGNIGQLWLKEQATDLQINIDGEKFLCHQFILCTCSELFEVLLQSEVKGDVEHIREVTVRGISPEIFRLILKAIYKGENGLNTENMMSFWLAVLELQIPVLVSKCETFVSSHINQDNYPEIYTSALLLESDKMIKMVHQFIAENFEYFGKCQLFLLLSSKTVHEILSSRNLKVTTQNLLVESILKWVSHEPCENNAKTVGAGVTEETQCAGDSVVQDTDNDSDQMLDHSTGVINDKKRGVEVLLQQPSATDLESCLQTIAQLHTETPGARKESLGKLLRLVRLHEASRDCLEMLADADIIMGNKETRDMVKQALETHKKAMKSVMKECLSVVADTSPLKIEQIVVFRRKDKIYAYSIDRNKLFQFMPEWTGICELLNIFTFSNYIFITQRSSTNANMMAARFPFSDKDMRTCISVTSCSVIVDDFLYILREDGFYRKQCKDGSCDWFLLVQFKNTNYGLVNIFKGNIIFCLSVNSGIEVYCFNIETRRIWSILKSIFVPNIVSFIHSDQLYILRGDGYMWNLTEYIDSSKTKPVDVGTSTKLMDAGTSTKHVDVGTSTKHVDVGTSTKLMDVGTSTKPVDSGTLSAHVKEEKLWDSHYKLFGAVVYAGSLLIFADLNCVTPSFRYKNTLPGVSEIRFIHLNTEAKCYPLVVPTSMLVREV